MSRLYLNFSNHIGFYENATYIKITVKRSAENDIDAILCENCLEIVQVLSIVVFLYCLDFDKIGVIYSDLFYLMKR